MKRTLLLAMSALPALLAACGNPGPGGGPGGGDDGAGVDASANAATWTGRSHMSAADGSVYDSVFTFVPSGIPGRYQIGQGQVNITTPPNTSPGCTVMIDPSHAMTPGDGMLAVAGDGATLTVQGQGASVWAATWTITCDNGTTTQMLPYAAYWWPTPAGSAPPIEPAPGGSADFDVSTQLANGHVSLSSG